MRDRLVLAHAVTVREVAGRVRLAEVGWKSGLERVANSIFVRAAH